MADDFWKNMKTLISSMEPTSLDLASAAEKSENILHSLVLLGVTGSGKSSCGNTILGGEAFDNKPGISTITQALAMGRFEHNCKIIDTPDICSLGMTEGEKEEQVKEWLSWGTPLALLFVISCNSRFTPGEMNSYLEFKRLFGRQNVNMKKRMIILLSHVDKITKHDDTFFKVPTVFTKHDDTFFKVSKQLDEVLKSVPQQLINVLRDARGRYIPFDNTVKDMGKKRQMMEMLMKAIKAIYAWRVVSIHITSNNTVGKPYILGEEPVQFSKRGTFGFCTMAGENGNQLHILNTVSTKMSSLEEKMRRYFACFDSHVFILIVEFKGNVCEMHNMKNVIDILKTCVVEKHVLIAAVSASDKLDNEYKELKGQLETIEPGLYDKLNKSNRIIAVKEEEDFSPQLRQKIISVIKENEEATDWDTREKNGEKIQWQQDSAYCLIS